MEDCINCRRLRLELSASQNWAWALDGSIVRLESENKLLRECISAMASAKSKSEIKRILTQAGLEPKTEG